jgi:SAM-dependent methyltransferase
MFDMLIVLQSHTKTSAYNTYIDSERKRYVGASKLEISKRCFRSLLNTIKYCQQQQPDVTYRLIVLDDDSDQEYLDFIQAQVATFPISVEHTVERGIMPSIKRIYEIGKEQGKNLVYFVQDDYLYYETALWEMIDAYVQFRELSKLEVFIYPYNDPYRRAPDKDHKLLAGSKRYWITERATACCLLVSHKTLTEEWELFAEMGNQKYDAICEDMSINRLFMNFKQLPTREIKHLLFVPVTSLALHLGFDSERDPYIDWRSLWNQFADPIQHEHIDLPQDRKIVANLGCWHTPLDRSEFTEGLRDYYELRVDLDESCNPHLVSDITQLTALANESVDCVFSSHSLEHVHFHDLPACIAEWYRVIKPEGEARIIVPNLKAVGEMLARGEILGTMYDSGAGPVLALDMIYGFRQYVKDSPQHMLHKTGFTKESAETILSSLGYTHFQVHEVDINLVIRLFKPRATPQWI